MNFSQERVKEVLFNMTKLMEDRIGNEMETAGRVTILHDGWSKNSVHYVAIYACYMREVRCNNQKIVKITNIPQLVLLVCSPMACIATEDEESSDNEEKEKVEESITFTAEVHTQFIRDTF